MTLLAQVRRALAVVAHPDDESFGLGAVLGHLVDNGTEVSVLCFTRGEASTLHARPGELEVVRAAEFRTAADVLGVKHTTLLSRRDNALTHVPLSDLVADVKSVVSQVDPSHLVVFDVGGVTGHSDHNRVTQAALAAAVDLDVAVIAWTVPEPVAAALNAQLGTSFVGRPADEIDEALVVDRDRQWHAIAAHASQSGDNPVLRQRLRLLGDKEYLKVLRSGTGADTVPAPDAH